MVVGGNEVVAGGSVIRVCGRNVVVVDGRSVSIGLGTELLVVALLGKTGVPRRFVGWVVPLGVYGVTCGCRDENELKCSQADLLTAATPHPRASPLTATRPISFERLLILADPKLSSGIVSRKISNMFNVL